MGLHPLRHCCGFHCRGIGRNGRHSDLRSSIFASGTLVHCAVSTTYSSTLGILTLAFLVYTLEIVTHFKELTLIDGMLFSSAGLIPFALLLWAWPRANLRA
jgi:hypothetical protein